MTALFTDQPSCIELDNHKDGQTGAAVIDSVVTATIFDSTDTEVVGQTWPLSLPYDAGLDKYFAETGADMELVEGDLYRVETIAKTSGGAVRGEWNLEVRATERGSS